MIEVGSREYPTEIVKGYLSPAPGEPTSDLMRKELYVLRGLNVDLATQLVERSLEPNIVEYYPEDSADRFASFEAVEEWQQKGRLSLPLARAAGHGALELVGFGWMGPKQPEEGKSEIPGAEITFATRLYETASGQGNDLLYARAILAAHNYLYMHQGGNKGVWLKTWGDNKPAIRTYLAAGFMPVAKTVETRHGQARPYIHMTFGSRSQQNS